MIATGTCHMSTATSILQNTVSKLRSHRSHSDIRASSPSISSAQRKRLSAAYLVPRVRKQLQEGLLFQTDSRQSRSLCGQSASTFSAVPGRFPVQSATRRHQIRAMSSEPPSEMSGRDGLRRRGGPATVNVSPSSTVISSASPSNVQPTGPASPSNVDIHSSAIRSNLGSSQTILTDLPSASTLVSNGTSQQSGENRGSSLTPDGWPRLTAVVAGAGPAGAFFALLLARQGYKVEVFERQEWDESAGTWARRHGGWNVALTGRAWAALESVGLTKQVEEKGMRIKYMTTLRGHGAESKLMARKVNFKHYSVAIPDLSEVLIRAGMERYPGQITYHFGMALKSADVEKNTATFSRSSRSSQTNSSNGADETVTVSGDLLVGADGLSSVMRAQMAEQVHQFSVLTDCRGTGKAVSVAVPPEMMAPPRDEVLNPLHGPRFQFDPKTFTVWVRPPMMLGIMPNSRTRVGCSFHGIGMQGQDAAGVSAQIKEYFPEVAELFPPDSEYCETLSKAKELRHCTVNSSQFHHNQTVLLGDAAHAVFNYIGQGTNLAMEDGLILENILAEEMEEAKRRAQRQQQPENRRHRLLIQAVAIALERFNAERKKETDAAAWMSEDIPKQDIKQVLAQNKFYEILGRFVPGFLTWQDALNKTLKPPSQIVRQRRLQMWAFRLVQYAAIVLALLAVAAVLKAVKPWALHVLKPKYA